MGSLVKSCLAWPEAARAVARWLSERERIDALLEGLPRELEGVERARCQHLVFGVVRHAGRIEAALDHLIAHPPRFETRAVLLLAGFELIEDRDPGVQAKIVHHAVEQAKTLASPAEARLVNAVARKLAAVLGGQEPPPKLAGADALGSFYSHPVWLVRRWLAGLGAGPTRALLEWNQTPTPVFVRWRAPLAAGVSPAPWAKATPWESFFEVESGHWAQVEAEIDAGHAYVQDPATRLAVDLLAPKDGDSVLDACAAPGGKMLHIADRIREGRLVAVDVSGLEPGDVRFRRLKENLATSRVPVQIVGADVLNPRLREELERQKAPTEYDAVLLDVPCSNTGVMRHRIDVKWRLQEADFGRHSRQQYKMLVAAAQWVRPGGRIVYSTCSVDPEENDQVVTRFVKARPEFRLEGQVIATPWADGHDGAAAFLLRRS
ncbi:MAG TPA: transcription antitermination factor NusB [Opitutaceae bacterium]